MGAGDVLIRDGGNTISQQILKHSVSAHVPDPAVMADATVLQVEVQPTFDGTSATMLRCMQYRKYTQRKLRQVT